MNPLKNELHEATIFLANKLAAHYESEILLQLKKLIDQGTLVVRETIPVVVQEKQFLGGFDVTVKQEVVLESRHQDVIDTLTKENEDLRRVIKNIREQLL